MIVEQVYIFGYSIITGMILGLIFDIFRGFRLNRIKDIWVYIQDIIFWIVTAIIIIISAFIINNGELRGYMLIGYLLGAGFYMILLSRFVLGGMKLLNKAIKKLSEKIINMLKKSKKVSNKQEI